MDVVVVPANVVSVSLLGRRRDRRYRIIYDDMIK